VQARMLKMRLDLVHPVGLEPTLEGSHFFL